MDEQMISDIAKAIFGDDAQWDRLPPDYREPFMRQARAAHSVMAGKVAELEELLHRVLACRMEAGEGRFVNLAKLRCVMPDIDAALAPYPERRSE